MYYLFLCRLCVDGLYIALRSCLLSSEKYFFIHTFYFLSDLDFFFSFFSHLLNCSVLFFDSGMVFDNLYVRHHCRLFCPLQLLFRYIVSIFSNFFFALFCVLETRSFFRVCHISVESFFVACFDKQCDKHFSHNDNNQTTEKSRKNFRKTQRKSNTLTHLTFS